MKLQLYLALIVAVVVAVGLSYFVGGRVEQKQTIIEDLQGYEATRKNIDEAVKDAPSTLDAARDYLMRRKDN